MNDLLHRDTGEVYKGSIHLALFGLASICAAYNLGALSVRPEWRLGANTGIYLALALFEAKQVRAHFGSAR